MSEPLAKYVRTDKEGNRYFNIYAPDVAGMPSNCCWGAVTIPPDPRIVELEAKHTALVGGIKCPDNAGGIHRFDGDGQCLDCCNYATDMIDRALKGDKDYE